MRFTRSRSSDSSFDLNLAPVLDIIVSIVPMLLLSVAFFQVKIIETPVPQVVAKANQESKKKDQASIALHMSKKSGFVFKVKKGDKEQTVKIGLKDQKFDLAEVYAKAVEIKRTLPALTDLDLMPSGEVSLNEMVAVMDQLRKIASTEQKFKFTDTSGKIVETDLLYPNVTFGNVVEE